MPIDTILFDADGVIQRPSPGRRAAWQSILGADGSVEDFVEALFAAERLPASGKGDFVSAVPEVMKTWQCCGTLEEALAAWVMIEPDHTVLETIQRLRSAGLQCHLATNQEPHRAAYMTRTLGYASLFDREFYSCHMGVAKPDVAYFDTIINALNVSPSAVLFLDDRRDNVAAAQSAGLHAAEFVLDSMDLGRVLARFGIEAAELR